MSPPAPAPRRLSPAELRGIVSDPTELLKGLGVWTTGGLRHLARFEARLFAEAAGAGASPYRVSVDLDHLERGRCTCMAARTRPFCKHAAALLHAWASQPEGFAVAARAPGPAPGDRTPARAVRRGAVDGDTLVARGVAQVLALVGELGVTGVVAASDDRAEQVRALAEPLRANRLRRLSARVIQAADLLDQAQQDGGVDPVAWTDLLADLLLSARRIERHLAGEVLEDRHVEELIGKTWTRKDRLPVSGLDLIEVAWRIHVTPDDFRIVESRHVDLLTGDHWSEKQILPMAIARRTEPRPSRAGVCLVGASGSRFPGFAPFRLDLADPGTPVAVDGTVLDRLAAVCLGRVGEALTRFTELRRDVFAPDLLPVAVRVDQLLAGTGRLRLVDSQGDTLFLPDDRRVGARVAESLRDRRLVAVFGDVGLDGALPTLYPLSLLVEGLGGPRLVPLVGGDAASLRARRPRRTAGGGGPRRWVEVARAAGVSRAAVALGEAREELARAVANGTAGFTPRAAEGVGARLRELGLEKPAQVVLAAAARPDPRDRLDDLVKVHQVTGIALTRLAGAVAVDRSTLTPVPTFPSVVVPPVEPGLDPVTVATRVAEGRLDHFQAAVATDAWYQALPTEALIASVYPTWADASASPFVVRAFVGRPDAARAAALPLLLEPRARRVPRTARLTALRVLAAAGLTAELDQLRRTLVEPSLLSHLQQAAGVPGGVAALIAAGLRRPHRGEPFTPLDPGLRAGIVAAPLADDRVAICRQAAATGDLDAIPLLRTAWTTDPTDAVRAAAATALAELLDLDSADQLLEALSRRAEEDGPARVAARAVGQLGDGRAVGPLLAAYAAGWHPAVCLDALGGLGEAALDALIAYAELTPSAAKRPTFQALVWNHPDHAARIADRVTAARGADDFVDRATALLALVGPEGEETVAAAIMAALPASEIPTARGLVRRCTKLLATSRPPAAPAR